MSKPIRHHDQDHYIRFYIVCKQIWRNKTDLHSVIAHLFKNKSNPIHTTTAKQTEDDPLFNRLPFSFSVNQSQNHYLATSSSDMCQLQQVKLITGISVSELSTNKKKPVFSLDRNITGPKQVPSIINLRKHNFFLILVFLWGVPPAPTPTPTPFPKKTQETLKKCLHRLIVGPSTWGHKDIGGISRCCSLAFSFPGCFNRRDGYGEVSAPVI